MCINEQVSLGLGLLPLSRFPTLYTRQPLSSCFSFCKNYTSPSNKKIYVCYAHCFLALEKYLFNENNFKFKRTSELNHRDYSPGKVV